MESADFEIDPSKIPYHDRLGVGLDSDLSTIRKAGKKAYKEYHPDQQDSDSEKNKFLRISDARQTLEDSDSRSDYKLFCDSFGDVEGTKQFEQWKKRGKPRTASKIVEDISIEKQNTTSDTQEEQNISSEYGESKSDTSSYERDSPSSSEEFDSRDGQLKEDTISSFDQSDSIDASVGMLLNMDNPSIVSTSDGLSTYNLRCTTRTVYSELRFEGFPDKSRFTFNIESGSIETFGDYFESVEIDWVVEDVEIRFKINGDEYIHVDLEAGQSQEQTTTDWEPTDPSPTNTSPDDNQNASVNKHVSKSVEDHTFWEALYLTYKPDNKYIAILFKLFCGFFYASMPKSVGVRFVIFLIWFGVAVSPIFTPLGLIGWMLLAVPFPRFAPWAFGGLTVYMILSFISPFFLPTGSVTLTMSLGVLLISIGYMILEQKYSRK